MTVVNETSRITPSGDGTSLEFDVTFVFLDPASLEVVLRTEASGAETVLTYGVDFTVTVPEEGSPKIVLTSETPPPAGVTVIIRRKPQLTQTFAPTENEAFPAASLEAAFDRVVLQTQYLFDEIVNGQRSGWIVSAGAPSDIAGRDGDLYLRSDTGQIYGPKAAGAWAAAVADITGPAGTTGAAGATWTSGAGAPSGGSGANGDLYLRTSNNDVYLKSGGSWSVVANLTGAAGAAGATGAPGSAGSTGSAGAAGADGIDAGFKFAWDSGTSDADPGTGEIRANHATLASASFLYISETDALGGAAVIATWDDSSSTVKGALTLRKESAPATFATFTITGAITDGGVYDKIPVAYLSGSGTFTTADTLIATVSRTGDAGAAGAGSGDLLSTNNLSDVANAATARTNLGLAIGSQVQAYDAELAAIAGLTSAADKGIQFTGSGTAALFDLTAAGKALLDDADAAAQRSTLGLVIGTNVQAFDAELAAIAGLTSAANKGIQFTGSGTAATFDLTAAGKALLDDGDATTQRGTLGLGTLATASAINDGNWSGTDLAEGNGGTGSSAFATASEYRANTASKVLATDDVWSAAGVVTLTDASTIAVDMSTFINAKVTLGGNRTLGQPSNPKVGQSGCVEIIQDATGSRTLAYHADWLFSGSDPTLSTAANARDLLFYHVLNDAKTYASLVKAVA